MLRQQHAPCRGQMSEDPSQIRNGDSSPAVPMEQHRELAKRAADVADSGRRFLAAINTGGIGVAFAVAGSLAGEGVPPLWAVWPVAVFSFGLVLTGWSWQLQKHKTIKRRDAAKSGAGEPDFAALWWRNQTYEALALVAFIAGVLVGLLKLSDVTITGG